MTVVIGLGNEFRGDDAVGLMAAELIGARDIPGVRVIAGVSDAAALIEVWDMAEDVYLIDCAVSGREPGTIYRFDGLNDSIPEDFFSHYSTHGFSLPRAIELADVLGRLPSRLIVYGIEGSNFEAGSEPDGKVQQAARKVVASICEEFSAAENSPER